MYIKKGIYSASLSILDEDLSLDADSTIKHAEKIIDIAKKELNKSLKKLNTIKKKLKFKGNLNDLQKSLLFIKMSELDNLLATGVDEEIILLNLFSYFTKILNEYTS